MKRCSLNPWWRLSRLAFVLVLGLSPRRSLADAAPTAAQAGRSPGTEPQQKMENVEIVDEMEIFTHLEEASGVPDPSDGTIVPHGREIRLRFSAFGERFDVHLSLLNGGVGTTTRVRALGAGGVVLADRGPRLCTYEGWLPHGGWVRAVLRSPTAVTVHFLHNDEIHSLEPVFGRRGKTTTPANAGAGGDPAQVPPRSLLLETDSAVASITPDIEAGSTADGGRGSANQRRRARSSGSHALAHFHVAYRRSELEPVDLGGSSWAEPSKSTPWEEGAVDDGVGDDTKEGGNENPYPSWSGGRQSGGGDRSRQQQREHQRVRRLEGEEQGHDGNVEGKSDFRMPEIVEGGVGAVWDGGPFGPIPGCPSSPRVFQMGIAMDTGYFKASTGYGVDPSGNGYGQPELSLEEAIDLAESEVQGIVSLVNVVFTDQLRIYIEAKSIEIRTEVEPEGSESLESHWNYEPIDHTRHQGHGRLDYGCPSSRIYGRKGVAFASGADHVSTLKGFAAWRRSLQPSERMGLWHLLTACYDGGIHGLTYIGAACSDSSGVGWVARRPFGTWEVMAHELGHAFGASDFLDTTRDLMRMTGTWNEFALTRVASKVEVCDHIRAHDDCFQPYEPTCGNKKMEPGEECDDGSPCCNPDTCKLVPNARCSKGPGWASQPQDQLNGTLAAGDWVGQCCSDECQFLSSATLCKVVGGGRYGVCSNGGCRRPHMATVNFWSYDTCVNPESPDFNPCVDHYQPISRDVESSSYADGDSSDTAGDEECMAEKEYPLRAGVVCDHEVYKECDANAQCKLAEPPLPAQKREVSNWSVGQGGWNGSGSNNTDGNTTSLLSEDGRGGESDGEDVGDDNDVSLERDLADSFSLVYEGCFQDTQFSKDLQGGTKVFQDLSARKCGSWCVSRGYSVIGLQNGSRCTCGDDFGGASHPSVADDKCSVGCSGDTTERCGAFAKNSIYSVLLGYDSWSEKPVSDKVSVNEQEDAEVGRQGRGAFAGSRIAWPRIGTMNSFPKYYDDVATRQESRPADAGDGGSVLLEYLGCFRDHPGNLREFYGPDGVSSPLGVSAMSRGQEQQLEEKDTVYAFPHSLTPHVCQSRCQALGMPYFGLQYGRECRCGKHPPHHAPAANCVSPCVGDRTYVCGGVWANTVYRIHEQDAAAASDGSTAAEGGGEVSLETRGVQAEQRESASLFRYLGCFSDGGDRDLNGTVSMSDVQSPEMCGVFCKSLRFPFFAVGWSRECSCGDRYGSLGTSYVCDYPCVGSPAVNCGGAWANSVYTTLADHEASPPSPQPQELAPTMYPTSSPTAAAPSSADGVGDNGRNGSKQQDPGEAGDNRPLSINSDIYPVPNRTDPPGSHASAGRSQHHHDRHLRETPATATEPAWKRARRSGEVYGGLAGGTECHSGRGGGSDGGGGCGGGEGKGAKGEFFPVLETASTFSTPVVANTAFAGAAEPDPAASQGLRRQGMDPVSGRSLLRNWRPGDTSADGGSGTKGSAGGGEGYGGGSENESVFESRVADGELQIEVSHPLKGELLTSGAVATLTWRTVSVWGQAKNNTQESIDLWLVVAGAKDELMYESIDDNCESYVGDTCQYSFIVPVQPVRRQRDGDYEDSMLELRGSFGSGVLGRSEKFTIKAKTSFTFIAPTLYSIPVRGEVMSIAWESTGSTRNVWITLNDAETGAVAAIVGSSGNTGSLQWILPHRVPQGVYYLAIRPLSGSRKMEKTAASEMFRVASPSASTMPSLAFVTPVLHEYVDIGQSFHVTWTSPDIDRVRLTLQNEWLWEVETLLFEGKNGNELVWKVPSVQPGVGYYLQLENPDDDADKQTTQILGGMGEAEFSVINPRGVRTRPFAIAMTQPKVSFGDIFKGQPGEVWTKGIALQVELENSATDESGAVLPVKLELMQGTRSVWTVPGSPVTGPLIKARMPVSKPPDGMYHARATSLLHPQAFDTSPEFEVTSYIPTEWGGDPSSLGIYTKLDGKILERGKSYEVRWSSSFVGQVKINLRRFGEKRKGNEPMKLAGDKGIANTGSFWLTVPFPSDLESWAVCPPPEIAPVVATNDTEEMVRSSSGRGSRSHSNDDDGDAGAVDNCCFTLSVSDVHNTKVSDNAGVFCVADPVHVGGGGLGDNSTSEAATLEVTVFPSDGWEKGSSQEIRWTSEGLNSSVSINIVGPATAETPIVPDNQNMTQGNPEDANNTSAVAGAAAHESEAGTRSAVPRRRVRLGSGLPTAGNLMAFVEPDGIDMPAGDGYSIEVMDATGNLNGVSPPFRLINPAGVIISGDAYDATVNKGDTSTVEWEFTGDSFPVRVQLFRGSSTPITLSRRECVPFMDVDDSWVSGCVQDPSSSLYNQCATEVKEDNTPVRTGFCMEPSGYMKLILQTTEIPSDSLFADVSIPREEFELPSVGPSYFWRVVSALDPQIYTESETFSVGYPSTLIEFSTTGLNFEEIGANDGAVLVATAETSLGLDEGRLTLWALNGEPFQRDDDISGNGAGLRRRQLDVPPLIRQQHDSRMLQDEQGGNITWDIEGGTGGGKGGDNYNVSIGGGNVTELHPESTDSVTVDITLKVAPTTSLQQRSPKQIAYLLGFLCEMDLLDDLGDVDCTSVLVRDELTSYDAGYLSMSSRSRSTGGSFLGLTTSAILAICFAIAIALLILIVACRIRSARRKNVRYWRSSFSSDFGGSGGGQRYAHPRDVDSDVISIEGEDAYGQIHSPGSFAGAYDDSDERPGGYGMMRSNSRTRGGFREAASTIVARVLSGRRDQSPLSRVRV